MAITFIVIGGGCYGSHHLRRLEKGRARGAIAADARILVVDRNPNCQVLRELAAQPNPLVDVVRSDWLAFMKAEFDGRPATDEVVPAPIAPHLAAEWLLWSLETRLPAGSVRQIPFEDSFGGLPYEYLSPAGERFSARPTGSVPLIAARRASAPRSWRRAPGTSKTPSATSAAGTPTATPNRPSFAPSTARPASRPSRSVFIARRAIACLPWPRTGRPPASR